MVRLWSLTLVTALAIPSIGQSQGSGADGSSSSVVLLHQRVPQSCDLLLKGTLVSDGEYAALRVEDATDEIYSPELGKDDVVGYPTDTPEVLVKLAKKSGFRMKPASVAELNGLPKLMGRGKDSSCTSLEKALQTAVQDRSARRLSLQAKLFQAGLDGVGQPGPEYTPQPNTKIEDASPESQNSQPPAGTRLKQQGTVLLWAVVTTDGSLKQIKVLRSLSVDADQKAIQTASRWRFKPARKDGLPVPVAIEIEVNFR